MLQAFQSNPVLSCILASFAVVTLAWYIRDSLKVDGIAEKFVLVTGCDSGFGHLLAHQLDQKGFHVIATCLTEKGCVDLRAETSRRLRAVLLNVTDGASIDSAVRFVRNETGSCGKSDNGPLVPIVSFKLP